MPQEDVMNATKLDAYRQRLRTLAQRLQGDARSIEEEARGASEGDNAGDLSHVPFHLADRATDELLVGLNATYLENEAKLLEEALAALRRIDDGSFGKCQRCSKAIGAARLDAIPFARLCIDCAKLEEDVRPNLDNGRPRGPEDTVQPEGYMNERNRREGSIFAEMSGRSPSTNGQGDRHATGTPGGGTAFGGLAGTNAGHGDPDVAELSDAHANGESDLDEAYQGDDDETPRAGHAGGAVGGTPVNKRSRSRE